MKSMKTLMISAAVCGAMALPISGTAQPTGQNIQNLNHSQLAAFIVVRNVLCAGATSQEKGDKSRARACGTIAAYMKENGIPGE